MPETKELAPSVVDCISNAEAVLALNYGKKSSDTEYNTLYDFITVDCLIKDKDETGSNVNEIKKLLCFDGLYLPLSKLEAVGYIPHNEAEIAEIGNKKYVRYRAAMQSASENRQCKLMMTTYNWENFAKTISDNAKYLFEPTQTAIMRQGLGKSNGNIVEGFTFTFAVVTDLEDGNFFRGALLQRRRK